MKTKKDVIERFKMLKGKEITVITNPSYIIGHFSPRFDTRTFHMRCSAIQTREIISVSNTRVVTRKISQTPVGFSCLEDFAKDWFYNTFLPSLRFHNSTPEQEEFTRNKLKEEFFRDLEQNILFHEFGFNDHIVCEFPKVGDMLILRDQVEMHENVFDLTVK
jgi:hypothetical protein